MHRHTGSHNIIPQGRGRLREREREVLVVWESHSFSQEKSRDTGGLRVRLARAQLK